MATPRLAPNRLGFSNLQGDIFGGITAGVVALPLALAFGVASGVEDGAAAGLYGAILVGFFAALFGGTPSQVSGPTGPITVVVAGLLAVPPEGGVSQLNATTLGFTVLVAGLLQILFGFAGLGNLIRFVPTPVISGFMSGIGVIIVLLQLAPLMGIKGPGSPVEALAHLNEEIQVANPQAVVLGLVTVALVYLAPLLLKKVPGTLVALIAGTGAAAFMKLDVPVIGDIPQGLPDLSLHLPDAAHIHILIAGALTIAVLGSIDSLLTSVVADNITRTRHSSNQELVGQGIGNAVTGLFGGLPGAGATMRTVINFRSGGRTCLSGMIHSVLLLLVLVALGPLAERIPLTVLAGILITVGIGIIDYKGLRHLRHVPRSDAVVKLFVLAMTVFADLIEAVGVGIVLSSLFFVKRLGDLDLGRYVPLEEVDETWADEERLSDRFRRCVYVFHSEGPFFFGSARDLLDTVEGTGIDHVEAVIIRMKRVPFIDQSGAYALEDLVRGMKDRHVPVLLTGLRPEPKDLLKALDIVGTLLPEEHVFDRFNDAVRYLEEHLDALREDMAERSAGGDQA